MASNEPRYGRPWGSTGLNWICAVIAVAVACAVLLGVMAPSEKLGWIEDLLLGLAILL